MWYLEQLLQWQLTGRVNLAGEITLVTGLIIWITSLPQIRRKRFEIFYYTHHLYVVFIIFFLFHGGDRHFYTVMSGVILFVLDKLLRVIQSRQVTCLVSARLLPCKAVEFTLSKQPGRPYEFLDFKEIYYLKLMLFFQKKKEEEINLLFQDWSTTQRAWYS